MPEGLQSDMAAFNILSFSKQGVPGQPGFPVSLTFIPISTINIKIKGRLSKTGVLCLNDTLYRQ